MNQSLQTFPRRTPARLAGRRAAQPRPAQHLLAAGAVDGSRRCWAPGSASSTGIDRALTPGIGLIVFLVGAFGFMFAIEKTKNSAAGVPMLLAFTFFMGLMLARGWSAAVLGLKPTAARLIMMAFAGTGAIFFGMASLSSASSSATCRRWASSCSSASSLLLVAGIANIFIQSQRADDHAVGAGDRHLLGVHPVRPEAGS